MNTIVCDESGYEGEKLIGTTTVYFAHASVSLTEAAAEACMQELRERIRSPATRYKANHILREKHRAVLRWFLGPQSPAGPADAQVFLIHKEFYLITRLVTGNADEFYESGRSRSDWSRFVGVANELMRGRTEVPVHTPDLDPIIPALVRAVSVRGEVGVIHDRQRTLTPQRVARIAELAGRAGGTLTGLSFAASHDDPRVQVADVLGGAARRIAQDGDPGLLGMLEPYIDAGSILPSRRTAP